MLTLLNTVSRLLSRFALLLAGLGLVAMTAIIGWQVFARYVLNASPAWSEQAALLIMLWYVLIAAAVGVRERFHIALTMLTEALSGRTARAVDVIIVIVVGAFGAALGVWGAELTALTWEHVIPTLGVPRGLAYLPLAVAGWLIVIFSVERLWCDALGREVEPLWR